MSHTPGPWRGSQLACGFATIEDQNGDVVFALAYPFLALKDKARSPEECEANARLIAAAPELLQALINLMARALDYRPANKEIAAAVVAINKARGEQP